MNSGVFGSFDIRDPRQKTLPRRFLDRELGLGGADARRRNRGLMLQQQIPTTTPELVIHYDEPVCCGQFSDDGNFFYNAAKDFKVRLYDTSNPYQWSHYKTVHHPFAQWTLTDAALSPDNRWLAFTSLQTDVCLTPTDPADTGEPYSLSFSNGYRFAIFSIRFSGDGKQLIAGTGADSIIVYDIERRNIVHDVKAHVDDVNAVCFADKMSPHVLYSGSDDCTIKVWDTRSLGDHRPAGAFVGHTQGITYIDSKGDGRYILSNGKEQSMKLWDLRMAKSGSWFEEARPSVITAARQRQFNYDYRWQDYDDRHFYKHPHDNSLVTFRGHKVQRTLIRCHFSPPGSTDSRYVYSGSHDGNIYVWNLDATIAAKIDVKAATAGRIRPRPHRRYTLHHDYDGEQTTLVRDVGWHPNAPILVASAWNGGSMDAGTASVHSWNDGEVDEAEPRMGMSVDEKLEPVDHGYYSEGGAFGI
ncbi:WD40-repeat-containing domain protein [Cladorrhinum sp. PSN332]|nr:WD40-repeat-containing domain protein [Cladorrhinum sp. PSN332]